MRPIETKEIKLMSSAHCFRSFGKIHHAKCVVLTLSENARAQEFHRKLKHPPIDTRNRELQWCDFHPNAIECEIQRIAAATQQSAIHCSPVSTSESTEMEIKIRKKKTQIVFNCGIIQTERHMDGHFRAYDVPSFDINSVFVSVSTFGSMFTRAFSIHF